jgi:phosphopantothenoylcysteine synthetase/decarboxylase
MHVLVTAGNTLALIDRVRCLTNIFTGRTGAAIATQVYARGHQVKLLTSQADVVSSPDRADGRWSLVHYRTFDDLKEALAAAVRNDKPDVLVHCAAVSDYLPAGVFAPGPATRFRPENSRWEADDPSGATLVDRSAGKIKSDEEELWIRLVRAPKLVDFVRSEWGFRGILVKFKLEVGVSDEQLLEVAERSRQHSSADLMVANTLEGSGTYAFIGPLSGSYQRTSRRELAAKLVEVLETMHEGRGNG